MRITASVLRGFIRETLLREGPNALGEVPNTPIAVSRSDTKILKKLQRLIGASETGKYDADTENAWDEYIAKCITNIKTINDAAAVEMSDEIREDWAKAAGAIEKVDGASETFTPDIQGMYDFARLIAPVAEPMPTVVGSIGTAVSDEVETSDAGIIRRPYVKETDPDAYVESWPAGVALRDAKLWSGYIDGVEIGGDSWKTANEIWEFYQEIKEAITAKEKVSLIGLDQSELDSRAEDETFYSINVNDVTTLDRIFNG